MPWKRSRTIIKREEEVEVNVFKYRCSFYELYFNEKLEPIEYGDQHIIDNKVYYFSEKEIVNRGDTILGYVDWDKRNNWGL